MIAAEQETTMTWDSERGEVRIFSARRRDQGVLKRAGILPYNGTKEHGFFYTIPLSRFKWGIRRLGGKKRPAPTHLFRGTSRGKKGVAV